MEMLSAPSLVILMLLVGLWLLIINLIFLRGCGIQVKNVLFRVSDLVSYLVVHHRVFHENLYVSHALHDFNNIELRLNSVLTSLKEFHEPRFPFEKLCAATVAEESSKIKFYPVLGLDVYIPML